MLKVTAAFALGCGLWVGGTQMVLSQVSGQPPPEGSIEASCTSNVTEFCKVKVDKSRNSIAIWFPQDRYRSSIENTYTGSCLDPGCVLLNPDWGYIERGTTRLLSITSKELTIERMSDGFRTVITYFVD